MSFAIRRVSDPERKSRRVPWKRLAMGLLTWGRPLLHWYWDWKERKVHEQRITFLKRILLILIAILLGLLVFSFLTRSVLSLRLLGLHSLLNISGEPAPVDEYGHTNILLLGQGDETGEDLMDSIIVASLDPASKSAVLLSLPRDLYLLKPEILESGKLNSRYRDYKHSLIFKKGLGEREASVAAIRELANQIGRSLSIEIHHAVKVDFKGFIQAVDAVGGIDIDVPYDILDKEYPGPNYTYEPFEIRAGPAHLDGATALKYARSRSTTSDFDRSHRQQQILRSLAQKGDVHALLRDPTRITRLINVLQDHIDTTATVREAIGIGAAALHVEPTQVITMQLHDRNGLYGEVLHSGGFLYTPPRELFDGASVLLPISIPEFPISWKQIQTLTAMLFDHRSLYLHPPAITILNAGAPPGSAAKLGRELTRYGFEVVDTANAPEKRDTSVIKGAVPTPLATFFGVFLSMDVLSSPDGGILTILLGKDYQFTPFLNLSLPPHP